MLKNKTWIVALLAALTMAFFGCTDAGLHDDNTEPKPLDDLEILGEDMKFEAVGNHPTKVVIDEKTNYITFGNANTNQGFAYAFPPESDGYSAFEVYFKIVSIESGRPGLLVKNTDLSGFVGITGDEDLRYQMNDADDDGGNNYNFTRGMEFDTRTLGITLKKSLFKGGKVAFFHQQYRPLGGNSGGTWTLEVVKIVFLGGTAVKEGGEEEDAIEYTGNPDIKQKVLYIAGEEEEDDVIIDFDPFVTGEGVKKIDEVTEEVLTEGKVTINKTTGVVSFDNTMTTNGGGKVSYKFPKSAYTATLKEGATGDAVGDYKVKEVGRQGKIAPAEEYNLETDYDLIDIEYEISNLDTAGVQSFKTKVVQLGTGWDGAAYAYFPGGNWADLGADGEHTVTIQTWGAGGKGGIEIHLNANDTKEGTLDFKITKVTFYKSERVTIKFLSPQTGETVKDVTVKLGNPLSKELPALKNDPWTFIGWYPNWVGSSGNTISAGSQLAGGGFGTGVADTTVTTSTDATSPLYCEPIIKEGVTTGYKPVQLYAVWLTDQMLPVSTSPIANATSLFSAVGSYAGALTYPFNGKNYWIVSQGSDQSYSFAGAKITDFDGVDSATTLADIASTQLAYGGGGYTRLAFDLSTVSPNWPLYKTVTITYDFIVLDGDNSNNGRAVQFRTSSGAGGGTDIAGDGDPNATPWLEVGNDKTITYTIGNFTRTDGGRNPGWIAIVNPNNETSKLLRISKVELK